MRTKEIGLMNGKCMSYGAEGSDEFNAGYELRQIQEKEEGGMTKAELIQDIKKLIEPDTTPDPDNTSDGELLDIIYDLVKSEEEV